MFNRDGSKKILIVSFSKDDWEGYAKILQELFEGEDIGWEFEAIISAKVNHEARHKVDLVLVASPEMKKYALAQCDRPVPIMTINHTLEKRQVDDIRKLCRHSRISVAADTVFYAKNRLEMLVAMGIPAQCLSAWAPRLEEEKLEEYVLLFEAGQLMDNGSRHIIEVSTKGRGLFSADTVVWILMALGRMDLIQKSSVRYYLNRIEPLLSRPIGDKEPQDYYSYAHDNTNRKGCILFTQSNVIYYCDNGAETLLNKKYHDIIGCSLTDCFPFMSDYIDRIDSFGEQIVLISGRQVVVDLWRTKTHGTYSGYIVLSDYAAETRKELRLRKQIIEKKHRARYSFSMIKGTSAAIENSIRIAKRVAKSEAGVLITGPSGSGKELFAQSIHNASSRKEQPFISVNCGALTDSLLESELFGYEAGAFTGAKKEGHMGLFEQAHNGTLFLDEVGDMPLKLQVKLLRVLQEREVVRVGGTKVIPVNIRIIAATHRNLREMVHEGTFRLDLYYRLNVLPIEVPGLNDRREDIMDIFESLEKKYRYTFMLSDEAKHIIICHNYEGNVRELQNLVEYLGSLGQAEIQKEDLPKYMTDCDVTSNVGMNPKTIPVRSCPFDKQSDERLIVGVVQSMNQKGIGAGRRSIHLYLKEQGIRFSEMKIRNILLELEQKGYVEIRGGRGGVWMIREY